MRALSTLAEKEVVEEYLDCVSHEQDWNPRYDIAPSLPVPVIRQHPKELAKACRKTLGSTPRLTRAGDLTG